MITSRFFPSKNETFTLIQQVIQNTKWPTKEESDQTANALTLYRTYVIYYDFKFESNPNNGMRAVTACTTKGLAQNFLPYIHIGDILSMYMHYDISNHPEYQSFHRRYGLIIDLSDMDFALENKDCYQSILNNDNHIQIKAGDLADTFDFIIEELKKKDIFRRIEEAVDRKQAVLIHCKQGVSRSALVSILYIMHHYKINFIQAFQYIKKYRPCIAPNLGFIGSLLDYEATLKDIMPLSVENAKSWYDEYTKNIEIERFHVISDINDKVTLGTGDKLYINKPDADGILTEEMIDLVFFLKLTNTPFKRIKWDKIQGYIELEKSDYEKMTTILALAKSTPNNIAANT